MKPINKHTPTSAGASNGVAEDYTAIAMRNIRSLQKQLHEIGERYQDEVAHPHATGSKEQEILREITRQMDSVQREIDALEQSILEHQAVEQLKKNKNVSLKIPSPNEENTSTESVTGEKGKDGVSKVKGASEVTSDESSETSKRPSRNDPTKIVGSIIDTTA